MNEVIGKSIAEMIDCFISSAETNNYYLLYLINKSTEQFPDSYINLAFQPTFTNRHAIICTFSVFLNDNQHQRLLRLFFSSEDQLSVSQKVNILKLIHFSLQKITKAQLFSQILKHIPASSLDEESKL